MSCRVVLTLRTAWFTLTSAWSLALSSRPMAADSAAPSPLFSALLTVPASTPGTWPPSWPAQSVRVEPAVLTASCAPDWMA